MRLRHFPLKIFCESLTDVTNWGKLVLYALVQNQSAAGFL